MGMFGSDRLVNLELDSRQYGQRILELQREVRLLTSKVSDLENMGLIRVVPMSFWEAMATDTNRAASVSVKDAIKMLMDACGVEFSHTTEKIEIKPKAKATRK